MPLLVHTLFVEQINLFEIPNGYAGFGQLICNQTHLIDITEAFYNVKTIIDRENQLTKYIGVRYALVPFYRWSNVFGHWITDVMGPLMFVPDWIWNLNPLIVVWCRDFKFVDEFLTAIGHPNLKVATVHEFTVYAEHLFVAHGRALLHSCGARSMALLREKLSSYYKLNEISPNEYGYMNKENRYRRFINMEEIIAKISESKGIHFTSLSVNKPNRESFARSIASLRILVCPCGSIAYNIIYMKPNTGLLSLNGHRIDAPNLKIAAELKIWHIQVVHDRIHHFGGPGNGDINRIEKAFNVVYYAVQNLKWPPNNYFSPINYDYFAPMQSITNLEMNNCIKNLVIQYKSTTELEE